MGAPLAAAQRAATAGRGRQLYPTLPHLEDKELPAGVPSPYARFRPCRFQKVVQSLSTQPLAVGLAQLQRQSCQQQPEAGPR